MTAPLPNRVNKGATAPESDVFSVFRSAGSIVTDKKFNIVDLNGKSCGCGAIEMSWMQVDETYAQEARENPDRWLEEPLDRLFFSDRDHFISLRLRKEPTNQEKLENATTPIQGLAVQS